MKMEKLNVYILLLESSVDSSFTFDLLRNSNPNHLCNVLVVFVMKNRL